MTERLNPSFISVLADSVGQEHVRRVLDALGEEPSVSVRVNPHKLPASVSPDRLLSPFGVAADPVPWSESGYILESRPSFTTDPLFHAGAYYVQDSSAMAVGAVFRACLRESGALAEGRALRVLDLCAAPGGKTTDLASSLRSMFGGSFLLVANEVMKNRASVLAGNVARWGDPCVVVTSADPAAFAGLEGFFDVIVADVPCSGEGMFRKNDEAAALWSEDNVDLCAARQRRILADVWPSLSDGGLLLYSTCTFNRKENDGNAEWIAGTLGADIIRPDMRYGGMLKTACGISLVPGFVRGEGQYCAALRKNGGARGFRVRPLRGKEEYRFDGMFGCRMRISGKNGMLLALPYESAADMDALDFLHPLMKGTAIGVMKGRDLVPHADLAMCGMLEKGYFAEVETDRDQALAFLHRDPLPLPDAPKGLLLLRYEGYGLGFVRNLGHRTNSLLPQGRRIRMDI